MADGNNYFNHLYEVENSNIPPPPQNAQAAFQAAMENALPEGAFHNYAVDDVNGNGAANNPLSPDAILAAIQHAMDDDAYPKGMPDAPPPSPQPVEPRQVERRFVELVFNGSTGQSVPFKLKDTTKFGKAMDAYSARVQQPVNQLRFLFEGKRLGTGDTPAAVRSLTPFLSLARSHPFFLRAAYSSVVRLHSMESD